MVRRNNAPSYGTNYGKSYQALPTLSEHELEEDSYVDSGLLIDQITKDSLSKYPDKEEVNDRALVVLQDEVLSPDNFDKSKKEGCPCSNYTCNRERESISGDESETNGSFICFSGTGG